MRSGTPRLHAIAPLLGSLLLAGCTDGSMAPSASPGDAEFEAVALFLSDADGSGGLLPMAAGLPGIGEFSQSRPCPGEGRELLAWANYRSGTTTTTVGSRQRSCEVSVVETFDAAAETFSMTGTICGRDVDVVRARNDKSSGD